MTSRLRITVGDVIAATAQAVGMTRAELLTRSRAIKFVRPRQIGIYVARRMTTASLPLLGRRFGSLDHTTILYALRRVPALIEADPALARLAERIERDCIDLALRRDAASGGQCGAPRRIEARLAA